MLARSDTEFREESRSGGEAREVSEVQSGGHETTVLRQPSPESKHSQSEVSGTTRRAANGQALPFALFKACGEGDLFAVNHELALKGVDVNETTEKGETPLWKACWNGHLDVVKTLLRVEGIKMNPPNYFGATPLFVACLNGHREIVTELLKCEGVNFNQGDNYGNTALYVACWNGHLDVVKEMLSIGEVDINQSTKRFGCKPLWIASKNGHMEVVRSLLSVEGVDVNHANKNGHTALHTAHRLGHVDIVRALIWNGANISDNVETYRPMISDIAKQARSDYNSTVIFRLCVFSARHTVRHPLYRMSGHGRDVIDIIEDYVVPRRMQIRRSLMLYSSVTSTDSAEA